MKTFNKTLLGTAFALSLFAAPAFAAGVKVTGFAAYQTFETSSGTSYTADVNGNVASVALGPDLRDMLAMGGRTVPSSLSPALDGIYPTQLVLLDTRNSDGSALAASAASGKFGASITLGTSSFLISEAANSSTKTDIALLPFTLPSGYVAGQNLTFTINAQYVLGSGTVGTHTINANAYRTANDGTQGSDLINVSAATVAATATDVTFTIVGTTLNPGDKVLLKITEVIQDTGGSNITAQVNSARIS